MALAAELAYTMGRGQFSRLPIGEFARQAGPRLADKFTNVIVEDIYAHATKKPTSVNLKYMLDFGSKPLERQFILSAQFLQRELPVRLAHRIAELENLPYGLSASKYVLKIRDMYVDSFQKLRDQQKVSSLSDDQNFTNVLKQIYERHSTVVPVLAMGVAQLRQEWGDKLQLKDMPEIHKFMDDFYMSRIGIRMLIGQHIELHNEPGEGYIGMIDTKMSPVEIANDAIADARSVCMRQYGVAPEVVVGGKTSLRFPYVPQHLYHMLFELVKNSLRAVHDRYDDDDEVPPPIRVIVAEGAEDICIKVADEGGGIPRSGVQRIFTYLYSTAKNPLLNENMDPDDLINMPSVLAGYGYGLPMSRLFAKYFGGDLVVISMDGYGTDAYLHLNRLGNSQEPLG